MLLLYASEIAACIGRHAYRPVHSAVCDVWQRTDFQSFQAARERAAFAMRTEAEREAQVQVDLSAVVDASAAELEAAIAAQLALPMHPPLDADALAATLRACAYTARPAARAALLQNLCGLPPAVTVADDCSAAAAARVNSAIDSAAQQCSTLQELEAACHTINAMPKQRDCPAAASALRSVVSKARGGSGREAAALRLYEALTGCTVTARNCTFYKATLPCGTVQVGGRVDGLACAGQRVVEVKCRQKRFFDRCVDYEFVQMQAYMRLTGAAECDLVQHFDGAVRVTAHDFDEEAWARVEDDLQGFAQELSELLASEALQDQFLAAHFGPPPTS